MSPRRAAQVRRPYGGCRSGHAFFVGAGPRPARRIRTGRDGSAKPGAGVKPHCPQFSNPIGRRRRPPTQSPAKRVCVGEDTRPQASASERNCRKAAALSAEMERWSERALSVRTKRGIRNPRRRRAQWPGVKCGKPLRSCTPEILQSLIGTRPPAILKVDCPEGAGGGLGHWFLSHRWERNSPPSGGETLCSLIEKSEKAPFVQN